MKYKLIKEYPNSPKLNSIVEEDSNGIFFKRIGELIYLYTKDQIKDYPEFWEEVKEYSFEILQFRNKITGTIFNRCIDIPIFISNYENCEIYSIKRKFDREIFTIGDKLQGFGKITKIGMSSPDYVWIEAPYDTHTNAGCILEYANKEKDLIFVTEDGKNIYCGDEFWFVDNLWNIGKGVVSHPVFKPLYGYKQFFSKEAAEKYIEENKPLYSKKQVINILKGFDRDINCFDERFDYNLYIERYKDEK